MAGTVAVVPTAPLDSAIADAVERYRAMTPRSAGLFEASCAVLPGGNTRSNLHLDPYPVVIERAHDAVLVDVDGNAFDDFNSDYTVGIHGHSNERIAEVITAQIGRGMSWGGRSVAESALATAIIDRYPMMEQVRFVNSGTEANLFALLTAMDATGRDMVLGFDGGYHGSMLSFVPAAPRFNIGVDHIVVPFDDVDAVEEAFANHGQRLAAVFIELMQNSGGCLPADAAMVRLLRERCDEHGVLLVVDEVMTARLGYHGLTGRYGVRPDLVTLGKFLGGGFPIGAVASSAEVMERFDMRRPGAIAHGGSFNNEIYSMECGVVALTELLTPDAMDRLNRRGDELRASINEVFARHGLALTMSGIGSTMALHPGTSAPRRHLRSAVADRIRRLFHLELLTRGSWIAGRGMIATNLANTDEQYQRLIEAFEDVSEIHAGVLDAAIDVGLDGRDDGSDDGTDDGH